MGFMQLEDAGKKALEQYPFIKRTCKRAYQLVSYATSNEKISYEGNVRRITPDDDFEYFYGYYDKSPWDVTDRFMIALKVKQAHKSVAPNEDGLLVLIDTENNNDVIKVGIVKAWNVQQGCMAQWMGPDFKSRIIYNDFRKGKYCSVIFNIKLMKEEKVLPLPIYDVSKDGSFALSLDFSRLHRLRPGYGYSNLPDISENELCPNDTCIWKMDISTGEITSLFKYTDLAAFESDDSMIGAEHKVNHLMINPSGKRFMLLHRWFNNGRKHTRLITVNVDKGEMYNLSDDIFVSHCYWKNDYEILSFLRKKDSGNHYYLMKDKTQEYKMQWPRLATDGHCSYSPDGNFIVTDSYPNRKRLAFVYICREEQQQPVRIAKLFAPFKYDNDCRCDLHPRWNHAGDKICIDSVHEGKRGMYVIPVTQKDIPPLPGEKPVYQSGKYKIVYVITNCKNSGPMNQTLNIIKNLDRRLFQPIVVTLFQEDLGNSVVQRYLDAVPEFYCLEMNKMESILKGKRKLMGKLEEIGADIVVGLGMPPYTMSLGYKKAVHLVTLRNFCHEDYPAKYGKKLGLILAYKDMALIKKQVKKGEIFVTCSKSLSEMYKEKENLEFSYIRNGVDVTRFTRAKLKEKIQLRERFGISKEKKVIVYSGQFIERKDQESAIMGILQCKHFKEVVLILLGDGTKFKELKEKYRKYENIVFEGNVTNIVDYLKAADVYVTTSKSEGMPNGVLEAMAVGLPVVMSDIPQHLEVFEADPRIGRIYKLGSIDDLANNLDGILEEDLDSMGDRCYCSVMNNFTAEVMSKNYQNLYLHLLKNIE